MFEWVGRRWDGMGWDGWECLLESGWLYGYIGDTVTQEMYLPRPIPRLLRMYRMVLCLPRNWPL